MNQRSIGQLVLGTIVILAGVVLLLDRLDVLAAGSFWSVFWPMLVAAFGVTGLLVVPRAWLGPLLVTALGGYWLLEALDVVRTSAWSFLLPVALIMLGLSILIASTSRQVGSDRVHALVFFWGADRRITSPQFQSAGLTAIFGGINLDLRGAGIVGRARVDAFSMFGGVEIKVPLHWRVNVVTLPLFGGVDNRTNPPADPNAPVLDVHVVSIFGGAGVKAGPIVPVPPGG